MFRSKTPIPTWHAPCINRPMQEVAVLASRALTAQKWFTAVADNVANVNSAGYRRLEMDFKESASTKGKTPVSYVQDKSITISHDTGVFESTGNPLDVAIGGEGYFAIQVGDATHYTRRGQFLINVEGTLVTPEGEPVLDNAGAQIQFPQGTTDIKIASDGTISTEQGQLAQLGVYTFAPEQEGKLARTGNTSFTTTDGSQPAPLENPVVRQGYVEASNVNAVKEMVTMQAVSKVYENTLNLMSSLNDLESRTIRTLGQTQ